MTDTVATRYAEALFASAKAQQRVDETLEQMTFLARLLREQVMFGELFANPDVDPEDKVGLLDRLLKGQWSELPRAFVQMVIEMDRADKLPDIADALQELADHDQGRLRVTVRSAHALSEEVLDRLQKALELRERKTIQVETKVDPELLGGLQVQLENRLIDGSVRRQLDELRNMLSAARVS